MKSQSLGRITSEVEVTNLDRHGLWLLVRGEEFFLPFPDFPWFQEAKVLDVLNVTLLHEDHLHWPALDVDLSIASLRSPESYPLVWQA
jgi:hypothetical protein